MKRAFGCLAFIAAVWLIWGTWRLLHPTPRIETLRGTTVQYYLTPETEIPFVPDFHSFEVDDDGFLVHLGHSILRLQRTKPSWDSALEPRVVTEGLDDGDRFTMDAGGAMFITRFDELHQLGPRGLQPVAKMPSALIGASSRHPGLLYVFGDGDVFLISDVEGSSRRITVIENGEPIGALCEAADGYYVATGRVLHQIYGERKRLVFEFPESGGPIESLACTDRADLLFASTASTVYALFGTTAVPITRDFGGVIRWRDGRLFVLDRQRDYLVGIAGIEEALATQQKT